MILVLEGCRKPLLRAPTAGVLRTARSPLEVVMSVKKNLIKDSREDILANFTAPWCAGAESAGPRGWRGTALSWQKRIP